VWQQGLLRARLPVETSEIRPWLYLAGKALTRRRPAGSYRTGELQQDRIAELKRRYAQ